MLHYVVLCAEHYVALCCAIRLNFSAIFGIPPCHCFGSVSGVAMAMDTNAAPCLRWKLILTGVWMKNEDGIVCRCLRVVYLESFWSKNHKGVRGGGGMGSGLTEPVS